MKLTDYFDFTNSEHLEAFKFRLKATHWPKDFIDKAENQGVEFRIIDVLDLCMAFTYNTLFENQNENHS